MHPRRQAGHARIERIILTEGPAQERHRLQPSPQGNELSRLCAARHHPGDDALEIGHRCQQVAEARPPQRAFVAEGDFVQPPFDHRDVAQGLSQPAPQQPRPHRRTGEVERVKQGSISPVVQTRREQLEVAHRVGVQPDVFARAPRSNRGDEGNAACLILAQVEQRRRAGVDGGGVGIKPKSGGRGHAKVLLYGDGRQIAVEPEGFARRDVVRGVHPRRLLDARRGQDFRGPQPCQLPCRRLRAHDAGDELAGADIDVGQPNVPGPDVVAPASRTSGRQAGEIVVGALVEQRVLDERPRRDHPHDLAVDQSLRCRRIAHLLAQGDLIPLGDELRDIAVDGVIRNPR